MKAIIFSLAMLTFAGAASAEASTPPPCQNEAEASAHQTTGDQSAFVQILKQTVTVAAGSIYQYAYFTQKNYANCLKQIESKDFSCNSAIVDVLQDEYDYPTSCRVIDSVMGDGNG